MKKIKALSIDAEFTSFDMLGGDMIALGAVEILEDLTLGREKVFYFRPFSTKYFSEKARQVHGISYFKASQFPHAKDTCESFLEWVKPIRENLDHSIPLAFYGSWDFDRKWIEVTMQKQNLGYDFEKYFRECDKINVLKMAKKQLAHVKGHKLSDTCRHYKIDLDHHEPLSDARGCALAYIEMTKGVDTWTGELF